MQTHRVMQQPTSRRSGDRLNSSHLRGHRLPRINPPQLPARTILDRTLTTLLELRDRRQPARTRNVLRTESPANRVNHRRIG